MNEKITKLHNEAIKHSFENGGLRISSHIPNDYIEKFAELIVKECIAQLDIAEVPIPIQAGLNLGKVAIKNHFGIAE